MTSLLTPPPRPPAPIVNILTNRIGAANVRVAWWMIALSMLLGAIVGIWSFGGPVEPPPGFETFDALPRRLVRLAHIAAVALPALNLLYVPWIRRTRWACAVRRLGCRLLLFGTVALPVLLVAAAFWGPALYMLPLPVTALVLSCVLIAAGLKRSSP